MPKRISGTFKAEGFRTLNKRKKKTEKEKNKREALKKTEKYEE